MSGDNSGDLVLKGMEEILGARRIETLLQQAGFLAGDRELSQEHWGDLFLVLEGNYGALSGRGIAWRAGRSAFPHALREYGQRLGLSESEFKLLPLERKIRQSIEAATLVIETGGTVQVRLVEHADGYQLEIENCPLCRGRHEGVPVCQFAAGFVQEGLYWLSGGKQYLVNETACCARGDPTCAFSVPRLPLH